MSTRVILLPTLILASSGCDISQEVKYGRPEQVPIFDTRADVEACNAVQTTLAAAKRYSAAEMAGCDGIIDDQNPDGFRVLRVNGYCEQDVCGSVLLGWYALQLATGRVFEVSDLSEIAIGSEVPALP